MKRPIIGRGLLVVFDPLAPAPILCAQVSGAHLWHPSVRRPNGWHQNGGAQTYRSALLDICVISCLKINLKLNLG